mmetsp:Transcript_6011/g.17208  ORF Transcript_6011/g.17208 Transcript_6011/m.17208 type:complete len:396 (+) Transcript_6011:1727-2914(+)
MPQVSPSPTASRSTPELPCLQESCPLQAGASAPAGRWGDGSGHAAVARHCAVITSGFTMHKPHSTGYNPALGRVGSSSHIAPAHAAYGGVPSFGRLPSAVKICITVRPGSTVPHGPSASRILRRSPTGVQPQPGTWDPRAAGIPRLRADPAAHHTINAGSSTVPTVNASMPAMSSMPVIGDAIVTRSAIPEVREARPLSARGHSLRLGSPPPLLDCPGDWDDSPWDCSLFQLPSLPAGFKMAPTASFVPSSCSGWVGDNCSESLGAPLTTPATAGSGACVYPAVTPNAVASGYTHSLHHGWQVQTGEPPAPVPVQMSCVVPRAPRSKRSRATARPQDAPSRRRRKIDQCASTATNTEFLGFGRGGDDDPIWMPALNHRNAEPLNETGPSDFISWL